MKKNYFTIALLLLLSFSFAQTKSTGTITLNSLMSIKIDKDFSNSLVTLTLTGPDTRWFGIGFNAFQAMTNGTDCVYYTTSFIDAKITGQAAPTTDAANNWTVTSNSLAGSVRTIVATRPFVGGTGDYTFAYAADSLNIIWAYGSNLTLSQHASSGRGSTALTFPILDAETFSSINNITIAPNPSNGIFSISKGNQISISKIVIYDSNAKLLKVIDSNLEFESIPLDVSNFSKGIYFVEISSDSDKIVRKIVID